MKSYPAKFKSFSAENCLNGSLAKVAKFHTNPFNFVACLPNPYKLSILGEIWRATILPFSSSKYFCSWLRLKFSWSFIWNGKHSYSFPVLSCFCNGQWLSLCSKAFRAFLFFVYFSCNKTVIPLALARYEMIIANSVLLTLHWLSSISFPTHTCGIIVK